MKFNIHIRSISIPVNNQYEVRAFCNLASTVCPSLR